MNVNVGQKTFNFALKTSADKASAVEAAIRNHATWMRQHHSLVGGDKIHLVHYYASKAAELKNPADPSQGTTGNVLFSINEVYALPEGIGQHLEKAMSWEHFQPFLDLLKNYGQVIISGGEVFETL